MQTSNWVWGVLGRISDPVSRSFSAEPSAPLLQCNSYRQQLCEAAEGIPLESPSRMHPNAISGKCSGVCPANLFWVKLELRLHLFWLGVPFPAFQSFQWLSLTPARYEMRSAVASAKSLPERAGSGW